MERVQAAASQMCGHHIPGLMPQLQAKGVVQAVKAVCALMGNVETQDITESVESFESVCVQFIPAPPTVIIDFLLHVIIFPCLCLLYSCEERTVIDFWMYRWISRTGYI
jgi:hypothetical protein